MSVQKVYVPCLHLAHNLGDTPPSNTAEFSDVIISCAFTDKAYNLIPSQLKLPSPAFPPRILPSGSRSCRHTSGMEMI